MIILNVLEIELVLLELNLLNIEVLLELAWAFAGGTFVCTDSVDECECVIVDAAVLVDPAWRISVVIDDDAEVVAVLCLFILVLSFIKFLVSTIKTNNFLLNSKKNRRIKLAI